MSSPLFIKAVENMREVEPTIYAQFFHKKVDFHHPDWEPVKLLQLSLAAHCLLPPAGDIDQAFLWAALKMTEYDQPVYFLRDNFAEVVHATNPPDSLTPDECKMPFPCFAVGLSRSTSKALFGCHISFLIVLKIKDGEEVVNHPMKKSMVNTGNKYITLAVCNDTKEGLPIHYGLIAHSDKALANWTKEYLSDFTNPLACYEQFKNTEMGEETEKDLPKRLGEFALRLIAVLSTSSLTEDLQESHHSSRKGHSSGPVRWHHPLWIGQHYTYKTEGNGTHASPRMHWRRGHIRRQHYGPGFQSVRLVWIEPVLVNKPVQAST